MQLGYDGDARPLLFVPEWGADGMTFPLEGQALEAANLLRLELLKVHTPPPPAGTKNAFLH